MNYPEKNFETYSIFRETFIEDQEVSDVEKHLKLLKANAVAEIYDRFDWPPNSIKTKKGKIEALCALFTEWNDSPPESAIKASLIPVEYELSAALIASKESAEAALTRVSELDFSKIKDVEQFEEYSGILSDFKDLYQVPDQVRKDTLKPLSGVLGRVQKVIKEWREKFDLEADLKDAQLKMWAKAYLDDAENKIARIQDQIDYTLSIKNDMETMIRSAEGVRNAGTAELCKQLETNFSAAWIEYPEQVRQLTDNAEITGYCSSMLNSALVAFAAQEEGLNSADLAALGTATKKIDEALESMKVSFSKLSTAVGLIEEEYKGRIKDLKPSSQMGLRKKLSVFISPAPAAFEGNVNYDITSEVMEDPEVKKAIQKVLAKKIKAHGLKVGDDLTALNTEQAFGTSVQVLWELE